MLKGRLRIFKYGNSRVIRMFRELDHSEEATAAAENLILVDPKGEVPEARLADWLEQVEWYRREWLRRKREAEKRGV